MRGSHNPECNRKDVSTFISQFRGEWNHNRVEALATGSLYATPSETEHVLLLYHMRVFTTVSKWAVDDREPPFIGLLTKTGGKLTVSNTGGKCLYIKELRYSVGLRTTWELDLPVFSMVTMADTLPNAFQLADELGRAEWTDNEIRPSIRATGVTAFASRILSLMSLWTYNWSRLLDDIDKALKVDHLILDLISIA
ncbi:hypothetical protein N656DRAFT_227109 [Canariomyces notabilis]|uniref:Uncharacterized protein n=1 Tax=Canariomyces notabilis TaxID=2074819 RepID=A0AAN6YW08_9PEZI|nr:hypothetical protein N656DRAFT_227109 [Canariomyces arenarius]